MKKVTIVLSRLFSIMLVFCMAAAFLVATMIVIALIVGGDTAKMICSIVANYMLPTIYISGAIDAFIGIIQMYLSGKRTFVLETPKKSS